MMLRLLYHLLLDVLPVITDHVFPPILTWPRKNYYWLLDEHFDFNVTKLQCGLFSNAPKRIKSIRVRAHVSVIDNGAFTDLGYLDKLDLIDNQLHHLYPYMFAELIRLRQLCLSHNKIR